MQAAKRFLAIAATGPYSASLVACRASRISCRGDAGFPLISGACGSLLSVDSVRNAGVAGREGCGERIMPTLNLRRLDLADSDGTDLIAALRAQLSPQGEIVSPAGRQLTQAVFGEALPPVRVVERICNDV